MSSTSQSKKNAIIEFENVGQSYGHGSWVLRNFSLKVQAGEFICILGPSGSGKSTLLRLAAGLEAPVEGRVESNSIPGEAGFIFQDANLLPWRNLRRNIELPLELLNTAGEPVENALALVGLQGHAEKYPHELSGGMKMRASLARVLCHRPKILFMDEPFSALDEPSRLRLQEEIHALYLKQNWTILFVTHSPSEAAFLASRILVLSGPESAKESATIGLELKSPLANQRVASTRYQADYLKICETLSQALRI